MKRFLLPYGFKRIGIFLVAIGIAGLIYYLWFDFILMVPVFAVFSSFFETKVLAIVRTNVADELIMLSMLLGFYFLAFSKEKTETEELDQIRVKAFFKAVRANVLLLLFSILFLYGNGFLAAILFNLFSLFFFYLVFFFFEKRH